MSPTNRPLPYNPRMSDAVTTELIRRILDAHPHTQAVYLYGSWGTPEQWPTSDIDIAVLLPPVEAKTVDMMEWLGLSVELAHIAGVEKADLINLRKVSALLRKEVIAADRRIFCADQYAADEFEMLSISFYQKMNEERRGIVEEIRKTGRAYDV